MDASMMDLFEHMDMDSQQGLNLFGQQIAEYPELQLDNTGDVNNNHVTDGLNIDLDLDNANHNNAPLVELSSTQSLELYSPSPSPSPGTLVTWLSSSSSYSDSFSPSFPTTNAVSFPGGDPNSAGDDDKSDNTYRPGYLRKSKGRPKKSKKDNKDLSVLVEKAVKKRKQRATPHRKWWAQLALRDPNFSLLAASTTPSIPTTTKISSELIEMKPSSVSKEGSSKLSGLPALPPPSSITRSGELVCRSEMPMEVFEPDTPASHRELQQLRSQITRQRQQDLTNINSTAKLATIEAAKIATMEAAKLSKLATMEATKLATMEATKLATMEATKLATMEATKLASTVAEASFAATSHASNQIAELKKLLAKSCYQTALMFKQRDEELSRKAREWDHNLLELKQFALTCQQGLERLSITTCVHCNIQSGEQQQMSL